VNILFITSDQQRADCCSFEGRRMKTPHRDMLARQGTIASRSNDKVEPLPQVGMA
jgi:arylsulfatase A-like enzyme